MITDRIRYIIIYILWSTTMVSYIMSMTKYITETEITFISRMGTSARERNRYHLSFILFNDPYLDRLRALRRLISISAACGTSQWRHGSRHREGTLTRSLVYHVKEYVYKKTWIANVSSSSNRINRVVTG